MTNSPPPNVKLGRKAAVRSLVYVTYLTALKEAEEARKNEDIDGDEWKAVKDRLRLASLRYQLERRKRKRELKDVERKGTVVSSSDAESEPVSIGRSWGIHNKRCLPWAKRRVWRGRAGPWLAMAKRLAREYWSGVEFSQSMGFTLFVENSDTVFDELCDLRKPQP